jgi:hypothetical protein
MYRHDKILSEPIAALCATAVSLFVYTTAKASILAWTSAFSFGELSGSRQRHIAVGRDLITLAQSLPDGLQIFQRRHHPLGEQSDVLSASSCVYTPRNVGESRNRFLSPALDRVSSAPDR